MKKIITFALLLLMSGFLLAKPIQDPQGSTGITYIVRWNHEVKIKAFLYKDASQTPKFAYVSCEVANMTDKKYWIWVLSYNFYQTINFDHNKYRHWTGGAHLINGYQTIYMKVISADAFLRTNNKFIGFEFMPRGQYIENAKNATFSVQCNQHYSDHSPTGE